MTSQFSPLLTYLLLPLGWLYRALVWLRLRLYRRGILKTHRAETPIVAVGNLTVGGSGKTPVVDYLLREATRSGLRAVSISRGYGGRSKGQLARVCLAEGAPARPELMGDEPFLLAYRNPSLAIYTGKDRLAAARLAKTIDRPDVILLDDGYQHLRLARDLNILLIDTATGLDRGRMLPRGSLREPVSAIGRADLILVTKAGEENGSRLVEQIKEMPDTSAPVFQCSYRPIGLRSLDGKSELPPESLAGNKVSLLAAIAQPAGFAATVEKLGGVVMEMRAFRDHHPYPPSDLAALEQDLSRASSQPPEWITTEKDAVKLRNRIESADKLWVLEMEVEPEPAAVEFFREFFSGLKK